jgi:hypothetical protein
VRRIRRNRVAGVGAEIGRIWGLVRLARACDIPLCLPEKGARLKCAKRAD